jgi:hypothetical protein
LPRGSLAQRENRGSRRRWPDWDGKCSLAGWKGPINNHFFTVVSGGIPLGSIVVTYRLQPVTVIGSANTTTKQAATLLIVGFLFSRKNAPCAL